MTGICNRAEVEGAVVSVGSLISTRFGAVLPFVLGVERPSGRTDRVPCCAMDQYAEELESVLSVGVALHVDGVLRWNSQTNTLGICVRPGSGTWWLLDDDALPPGVGPRVAEYVGRAKEPAGIMAMGTGSGEDEKPESAREMGMRVLREFYGDGWKAKWKEYMGEEADEDG